MFRTPLPNEDQSKLETLSTGQLLGIFESQAKRGLPVQDPGLFAYTWGILFSRYYLSAQDLVAEMQQDGHMPGTAEECMLREFVRTDCKNGGQFVLRVIKKGGMIDRAALIMIADLNDLAAIEFEGTTAIHILADACDKVIRPLFIRRAGPWLLSKVYDKRGIPAIYTIFSLGDISREDLAAIADVFSEQDLKNLRCRGGAGKDALTVFDEVARSLKSRAPLDRHTFYKPLPPRDTGAGDR